MSGIEQIETVIVGSGFSGLAMALELKRSGREDFVILERARDVGGTWRDNSYPGCACDVPSHLYSFEHAPNPEWSSTFSPQPEIRAYIRRVAEDEGLVEHVRFGCEVESAVWDEADARWQLETSTGPISARALVAAAGPLSEPSIPDVPGLGEFPGRVFHSATWDHDHDLRGERVAVVGTGASAIQFVPEIQAQVGELHLFQRTAPWVLPRPDRKLRSWEHTLYRRVPAAQRLMRRGLYWARELFALPLLNVALSHITRVIGEAHLRGSVRDKELRRKLTPDYAPGCKRILLSNDYLRTLAKDNVDVVTGGVAEVRGRTVVGSDGSEREVDTIILGTGFHVTDLPIAERIRGRDGRSAAEHFAGSPQAHRGTTVDGFPNAFLLLGPNTGLGHTSVVLMAEAQARYVRGALEALDEHAAAAVEVKREALEAWNADVQRRMHGTVWTAGGCASWYLDSKGLNTTLWPNFAFRFRHALRRFDPAEHEFTPARPAEAPVVPERIAA